MRFCITFTLDTEGVTRFCQLYVQFTNTEHKAIGLYYYLRVAVSLYLSAPEQLNRDAPSNWQYSAGGIVVLISALLVLVLGVWPQPLISIVQLATPLM